MMHLTSYVPGPWAAPSANQAGPHADVSSCSTRAARISTGGAVDRSARPSPTRSLAPRRKIRSAAALIDLAAHDRRWRAAPSEYVEMRTAPPEAWSRVRIGRPSIHFRFTKSRRRIVVGQAAVRSDAGSHHHRARGRPSSTASPASWLSSRRARAVSVTSTAPSATLSCFPTTGLIAVSDGDGHKRLTHSRLSIQVPLISKGPPATATSSTCFPHVQEFGRRRHRRHPCRRTRCFPKKCGRDLENKELVSREDYVRKIHGQAKRHTDFTIIARTDSQVPLQASTRRSPAPTSRWPTHRCGVGARGAADTLGEVEQYQSNCPCPFLDIGARGGETRRKLPMRSAIS